VTKVAVDVPDKVLFALTDQAEAAGMSVAEYLLHAGLATAGITEKRESTIGRLVGLGMSDAQIARRLNTTNAAVAWKRRQLGMPANHASRTGDAA
jgi:DNA-binding NarL/FixJ family response regulator